MTKRGSIMASSFVIHHMYLFAAFTKNSVCSCEKTIEPFILRAFTKLIYTYIILRRLILIVLSKILESQISLSLKSKG
jgi:hypothetical protein